MAERSEAERLLAHGARFPYDAPDAWWRSSGDNGPDPLPAADWAHAAARGVLSSMTDRRGIKNSFDGIDEETRAEIVSSIAEVIRAASTTKAD